MQCIVKRSVIFWILFQEFLFALFPNKFASRSRNILMTAAKHVRKKKDLVTSTSLGFIHLHSCVDEQPLFIPVCASQAVVLRTNKADIPKEVAQRMVVLSSWESSISNILCQGEWVMFRIHFIISTRNGRIGLTSVPMHFLMIITTAKTICFPRSV